jgi:hypothetical protein
MRMLRKRGSVDWTVGKLIKIVLAVVLIVLFLFGLGTYDPLLDDLKQEWSEMVYMVSSVVNTDLHYECNDGRVGEITGGKTLLSELGAKEATFAACEDGVCEFSYDDFEFRLREKRLEKKEKEDWVDYSFVQSKDVSDFKEDWMKYNLAVGFLKENGVYDLYEDSLTRRFVLYGDGAGSYDYEVYAIWQSGEWAIQRKWKKPIFPKGDDEAFEEFVEEVDDAWDDKVYWNIEDLVVTMEDVYVSEDVSVGGMTGEEACVAICGSEDNSFTPYGYYATFLECNGFVRNNGTCCCYWGVSGLFNGVSSWRSIDSLVGVGNNNGELDREEEKVALYSNFTSIKRDLLIESSLRGDDLVKFDSLAGKKIDVDGVNYVISIDSLNSYFPVVIFTSSNDVFALKIDAFADLYSDYFDGERLDYNPIYLVEKSNDGWVGLGDEDVYRLSEEKMLDLYRAKLVANFLGGKCK